MSTWTYVHYTETGKEWPYIIIGWVHHRLDLSDVDEPYLSAIKAARARKAEVLRCSTREN